MGVTKMSLGLKLGQLIIKLVFVIASVGLLITMVTVVLNVLGRGFFSSPLLGTVEIVGMAGLLLVPFAMVVTERNRAQIVVRMLVSRFSQRLQSLFVIFTFILSLVAVALLVWGGVLQIWDSIVRPDMVTPVLRIPKAPLVSVLVVGCLILFGILLKHLIEELVKGRKK
jgi:TRAP-type C4-dicarboxylate transport system permease small subunit